MKRTILLLTGLVLVLAGSRYFEGTVTYTQLPKEQAETIEISKPLLFVGDIMLGRHVETLARKEGNPMRSFANVRDFLSEHVTIANLEGPIPEVHKQTPVNGFSFSFPSSTPRVLKDAGITAVSLANNHMFDQGKNGYIATVNALSGEGVRNFGGYSPTEDSFFEYSYHTGDKVIVFGITMIANGWDEERALHVAQKIAKDESVTVVAFLHWGEEYVVQNAYQRAFAKKLIDAGVDVIIGAHPHVIQGIESYKGKPIFYSLGNFIFDQYWHEDTEKGYALRMMAKSDAWEYDIIPVEQRRSVVFIATSTQKQKILEDIASRSDRELADGIRAGTVSFVK